MTAALSATGFGEWSGELDNSTILGLLFKPKHCLQPKLNGPTILFLGSLPKATSDEAGGHLLRHQGCWRGCHTAHLAIAAAAGRKTCQAFFFGNRHQIQSRGWDFEPW